MSDVAIRVEGLGKQYRVGSAPRYGTLRDALVSLKQLPGRLLRRRGESTDRFWALKDVSFEVKRGEVVGIIGRNGAGKSTLLKILSRITEPTEGGADIYGRVGSLLEVGTGFHPELTGRENIFLNGAILGMKRTEIRAKFDEIVAFAEVEKFIDTPVKHYSSGMYMRLAFAVAAHLEPEILIVDEVLAVGDAEFQKKCLGKMGEVSKQGRTVFFVSHHMASIEALSDRVMLLGEGKIVVIGEPTEVTHQYLGAAKTDAGRPLRHRSDREGDGRARCVDIWISDKSGNIRTEVISGQEIQIHLEYETTDPEVSMLEFNLGLYDHAGICLTRFSTSYSPNFEKALPRKGIAVCTVPRIPLPAGQYSINASIFGAGSTRLDRIENADVFQVVEGDFFGTGKIPTSVMSRVLVDHRWHVEKDEG